MQNYSAHNDTLPYVCSAETAEGPVQILTHDKVAFFFRNPHASVMPAGMVRSKYAGCTLLWKTSDPSLLADLHDEVGRLVQQLGATGLFEIEKSVKAAMMLFGPDISRTIERAKAEGIEFPLPSNIVENLKRFQ